MSEMVLVTGGAGFIGNHLAEELLIRGYKVRILDNFSTGNADNLLHLKDDVEIINGDICDYDICVKACSGVSKVWHLAAIGSVPYSIENPIQINAVICGGTLNMLQAVRNTNISNFTFTSSCSVYGANENLPISETEHPMPLSPYAVSKLAAEYYITLYHHLFGINTQIFRCFNIYGPRQSINSQYAAVIPQFINSVINNQQPVIYGDGTQGRDFVYVGDCANILATVGSREILPSAGDIYNLATEQVSSIIGIFNTIKSLINSDITPIFKKERKGEIKFSCGNASKLLTDFNISPATTIEDGLKITCDWFMSQCKKNKL